MLFIYGDVERLFKISQDHEYLYEYNEYLYYHSRLYSNFSELICPSDEPIHGLTYLPSYPWNMEYKHPLDFEFDHDYLVKYFSLITSSDICRNLNRQSLGNIDCRDSWFTFMLPPTSIAY